jgi:thioredoxin 1
MTKVKRFTAAWCSPCRALSPLMEEIQKETPGVTYEVIDVDNDPDQVSQYGIRSIPVVIVEKNGVETSRFVGVQSKEVYEQAIK